MAKRDTVSLDKASTGVILTGAKFVCTGCGKLKPASAFGLRKMGDNKIRNQPQCKTCRTVASKLSS